MKKPWRPGWRVYVALAIVAPVGMVAVAACGGSGAATSNPRSVAATESGPAQTSPLNLATPPAAISGRVLLVARDGASRGPAAGAEMELMLTEEVGVMVDLIEEAGAKVVVASASGKPIVGTTTTLRPDLKLSEVDVGDYAGFILPCMAAGFGEDTATLPPEALEIVKKAVAQGRPLAAQQSAVLILAKAGVLDGRRFAIAAEYEKDITVGICEGAGVVEDGRIITAGTCPMQAGTYGLPDTTSELTRKFTASVASLQ